MAVPGQLMVVGCQQGLGTHRNVWTWALSPPSSVCWGRHHPTALVRHTEPQSQPSCPWSLSWVRHLLLWDLGPVAHLVPKDPGTVCWGPRDVRTVEVLLPVGAAEVFRGGT